jgi:hypothetical protein
MLRCQRGPARRIRVAGLNSANYARIRRTGAFGFRLRPRGTGVRGQQLKVTGSFNAAERRARGTLRLTGTTSGGGRCDTRPIAWTVRFALPPA